MSATDARVPGREAGEGCAKGSPREDRPPADSHRGVEAPAGRVVEAAHRGVQDEGQKLQRREGRGEGGRGGGARKGTEPTACLLAPPTSRKHLLENPANRPKGWEPGCRRQAPEPCLQRSEHERQGAPGRRTCRCRLLMRQVTPKPMSSRLVRVKALMALVSF